jgi:hypothetical protein
VSWARRLRGRALQGYNHFWRSGTAENKAFAVENKLFSAALGLFSAVPDRQKKNSQK